jgi:hypothetical protein
MRHAEVSTAGRYRSYTVQVIPTGTTRADPAGIRYGFLLGVRVWRVRVRCCLLIPGPEPVTILSAANWRRAERLDSAVVPLAGATTPGRAAEVAAELRRSNLNSSMVVPERCGLASLTLRTRFPVPCDLLRLCTRGGRAEAGMARQNSVSQALVTSMSVNGA